MRIHADFDGGNIEVVSHDRPDDVQLKIKKDENAEFLQWFCFRVSGAKGVPLTLKIVNARHATYLDGWEDYRAVASSDRVRWQRISTNWDEKTLTFTHTPDADAVWYAYFAPYGGEYLQPLVVRWVPILCCVKCVQRLDDPGDLSLRCILFTCDQVTASSEDD